MQLRIGAAVLVLASIPVGIAAGLEVQLVVVTAILIVPLIAERRGAGGDLAESATATGGPAESGAATGRPAGPDAAG
ncbi:MAG TPA: hypothetical protein VLM11_23270 [Streptosporangiaceae bacterium]|nr:hypothetical protein [Streptosporangiaceae bacterium]